MHRGDGHVPEACVLIVHPAYNVDCYQQARALKEENLQEFMLYRERIYTISKMAIKVLCSWKIVVSMTIIGSSHPGHHQPAKVLVSICTRTQQQST